MNIAPGGDPNPLYYWPSVKSRALEISTDSDCISSMNPDMVLFSNPLLDDSIAPGNSASPSNQHALATSQLSDTNIVTRLWPKTWAFKKSLEAIRPIGNQINSSCGKNMDPDIFLGSSPGLDVTMSQESAHTTKISMALVSLRYKPRLWVRRQASA